MSLRYAELFAGLGLGSLAMKKVFPDSKCVFYSEIEKHRNKLLEKMHPGVKNIGDIDYLEGIIDNLPSFDIVIGGSPCKNLSIANTQTREGLKGHESALFFRYLELIKQKKPKYFLLENVASMPDDDKHEITRCLAQAMGQRITPIEISSLNFTGQDRKRYYWCNWPALPLPTEAVDPRHCIDKSVIPDKPTAKFIQVENLKSAYKPSGKMANPKNFAKDSSNWDFVSWSRSTRYPEFDTEADLERFLSANPGLKYNRSSSRKISHPEFRIKINMKANTLVTGVGCTVMSSKNFIRHKTMMRLLTPVECARLQGIPDGHMDGFTNGAAYKAIGDSFTLPVVEHILMSLKKHIEKQG